MSYVESHMREALKNHILVPLDAGKDVQSYYLKPASRSRMMSTLITFTPEGIVLQGDLTPGQNGNVSVLGYGVKWFSGSLSEGYLCGKFLTQKFVAEYAINGLREELLRQRREGNLSKNRAMELWEQLLVPDDFTDPANVYDFWCGALEHEDGEGCPGYGYDPAEAGWLCAIQQRFAQVYYPDPNE